MERFGIKRLLRTQSSRHSDASISQAAPTTIRDLPPPRPPFSAHPPRVLIVGAGSRGNAYARAIMLSSNGLVAAVAEPVEHKRVQFGRKHIWGIDASKEGMEFPGWEEFIAWEVKRRERKARGEEVPDGVDGVIVCTLDETHADVIVALAPLNLHILAEKPLATNLDACLRIYESLLPPEGGRPTALFAIGHVLRYSPHNIMLRKLLLDDEVIGDVVSVEHVEPVGWWHFAHSYVRGNWRKESTSGPSLLCKSCHDIDLILWMFCSPRHPNSSDPPHMPSTLSSFGSLVHFKPSRKPEAAGTSTNCLSCLAEPNCRYSAKQIYVERGLMTGNTGWPLDIVVPEIEDFLDSGLEHAKGKVLERLAQDYTSDTNQEVIDSRNWFGRCVYESDNDVCDDQVVSIAWEDDPLPTDGEKRARLRGRGAKTATIHMVAFTEEISTRRTRVYGTKGEIVADGRTITISLRPVHDFSSPRPIVHHPQLAGGGHGGGDDGLMRQFMLAIDAVKNHGMSLDEAQKTHIGCTLEKAIRSHAFVFAAEEARNEKKVVHWGQWLDEHIGARFAPK